MKATYRVYGMDGHRQRESFFPSHSFVTYDGVKISVRNCDTTGTNDYSEVEIITPDDCERDCYRVLMGQISDGIFEESRTGEIVELESDYKPMGNRTG